MFLFTFKPEEDGISHINIYSMGKTKLGKFLSHFFPVPVTHPKYGKFPTIENFWQYVSRGAKAQELRTLPPHIAKSRARQFPKVPIDGFDEMITELNEQKLRKVPKALEDFINSTLPFDHYYLIPSKKDGSLAKVRPADSDKLVIMFENLRVKLRREKENATTDSVAADVCVGSTGQPENS